ncbi:MAG TPA: acyltransferase [Desulfocapsa sulfexigens]|nr:acyltransferase [Desulfocapsa sulfexigens]
MKPRRVTQTREELRTSLAECRRRPHSEINKGRLLLSPDIFNTPGHETNIIISRFSILDNTGSIHIGPWCMIGARARIYTHDHMHRPQKHLHTVEEQHGILWQDKYIGEDVWIHDAAIVLYQVTVLPDGFVLGAGSVLTKNPGAYEIWAGVPARKIGNREDLSPAGIKDCFKIPRFSLKEFLHLDTLKETEF